MQPQQSDLTHAQSAGLKGTLTRNIAALVERRREEERRRTAGDRIAARVTRFVGSLPFLWLHAVLVLIWLCASRGWLPVPRFDPGLTMLATFASVEAIFLSTFVLINQNRMAELADRRADLDLQVSLLSEHELTRLLSLMTEVAQRLGVDQSRDPALRELGREIAPERVLDQIEETTRLTSSTE